MSNKRYKQSKVVNNVQRLTKYKGCNLKDFQEKILQDLSDEKTGHTTGNTITCRQREPRDYWYMYLGTIKTNCQGQKTRFRVYKEHHYFFNSCIIFEKVGKGGVNWTPGQHINDDLIRIR